MKIKKFKEIIKKDNPVLSIFKPFKFSFIPIRGRIAIKIEYNQNLHEPSYFFLIKNKTQVELTHV